MTTVQNYRRLTANRQLDEDVLMCSFVVNDFCPTSRHEKVVDFGQQEYLGSKAVICIYFSRRRCSNSKGSASGFSQWLHPPNLKAKSGATFPQVLGSGPQFLTQVFPSTLGFFPFLGKKFFVQDVD